jgi:hypothetical protein
MTAYLAELKKISYDLHQSGVPWCLVGGLACSVYGDPRTTKDIDVAVACDSPETVESLLSRLESGGYGPRQLLMHVSPTHRMGWRLHLRSEQGYEVPLDLLASSSGIEREIVSSASVMEILPALLVPVASRAHLIAMKILSENGSDRIRDRADLAGLVASATDSELNETQRALTLIESRGFARGKDLSAVFREMVGARR